MNKPGQTRTKHVLHFTDLSPRDFERLCLWLLKKEGFDKVDHIGASGTDGGCDISAIKNGQHWVCQCKRVSKFGPKEAEVEVFKILNSEQVKELDFILFIVTCDISKKTREIINKLAGQFHCEFWSLTVLDERVKAHQSLVNEFFKPDSQFLDTSVTKYGFPVNDYFKAIDSIIIKEHVLQYFVPLLGEYEGDENSESVDVWSFTIKWLQNSKKNNLAILGDYGTGKTWLCLRFTKELIDIYRNESETNLLPIFLSFKSYRTGMNLTDLISITFARDYGILSCDTYKIQQAIFDREAVLILDGLDEMVRELGQRDALVQFARLGLPNNIKSIVTCRTHYFLSGTEQREILNPEISVYISNSAPFFDILHLKLLSKTLIEEAIRCRINTGTSEQIIDFVNTTYNLPELCARPVLLSLVCQSYEALKTIRRKVTSADLYESYLNAWLRRELESGRLDITPDNVLKLLEIIAENLVLQNSLSLSFSDFEKLFYKYCIKYGIDVTDRHKFVRQLTTCTFLKRIKSDSWIFVHRSFQEFLYAKRFFRWEKETNGSGNFPVTHIPAWQFISQIALDLWNREKAEEWIIERIRREEDSGLCKTTLRAAAAFWLLHTGIGSQKDYSFHRVMLDCVDLKGVNFYGCDFSNSDFNSSDLRGANLNGVNLCNSILVSTDFSGADLSNADLRGSDHRGANFDGANLSNVKW